MNEVSMMSKRSKDRLINLAIAAAILTLWIIVPPHAWPA
jgi:hypothetical protein